MSVVRRGEASSAFTREETSSISAARCWLRGERDDAVVGAGGMGSCSGLAADPTSSRPQIGGASGEGSLARLKS